MDPESDDIQSHNVLSEHECRPRALEHYCLAAFVSDLRIEYPKNVTFEDSFDDNFDDDPLDPAEGKYTRQPGPLATKWNCYQKEKSSKNTEVCELQYQERSRESLWGETHAVPSLEK